MRGNGFDVDLRAFNDGIYHRQQTTDEALPQILNKAGGDVSLRAAQFTAVASKAAIRAGLRKDPHLLAALTSIRLQGQKLKTPDFAAAMKKYEETRLGGWKYLRSGWAPAARAFDRKFRGGVNQKAENRHKSGLRGYGKKATRLNLAARLAWITLQPSERKKEGAEKIAAEALQKALNFVGDDMVKHAQEKLAKLYL